MANLESAPRSLRTQAFWVAVATGLAQALLAIAYILAARSLPPADYGVVATNIATAIAFAGLIDFGTSGLWVREVASGAPSIADLASRVWLKTLVLVAVGLVACGVAVFAHAGASAVLAILVGVASGVTLTLGSLLRGYHRAQAAAGALMIERTVGFVVVAIIAWLGKLTLATLPFALLIGASAGILSLWRLLPPTTRPPLRGIRMTNPWRGSGSFGVASISSSLQSFDLTVLRAAGGELAAGVYASVSRWTQPMALLSNAFTTTAAPFLASAASGREAVRRSRDAVWMLVVGSIGAVVVAVAAPQLVTLLLGDAYADAGTILRLLAVGTVFVVWNQPLSVLLQSRNRDRIVAVIRLGGTVAFLVAITLVAQTHGALGAAWAYVGLQVFNFAALGIATAVLIKPEPGKASAV